MRSELLVDCSYEFAGICWVMWVCGHADRDCAGAIVAMLDLDAHFSPPWPMVGLCSRWRMIALAMASPMVSTLAASCCASAGCGSSFAVAFASEFGEGCVYTPSC